MDYSEAFRNIAQENDADEKTTNAFTQFALYLMVSDEYEKSLEGVFNTADEKLFEQQVGCSLEEFRDMTSSVDTDEIDALIEGFSEFQEKMHERQEELAAFS